MNFLKDIYHKTLVENEKNLRFWEDYLVNLKSLNFETFADKLTVPALVPLGSRILFRGELKHTNEITVALGAGYFAKCSVKQAEVLRQHRIKDAQSKLETFKKEREYIEKQFLFSKQNVYEDQGQDIVEVYSEEEDKTWREKHRENVRLYKQKKHKEDTSDEILTDLTDEELWTRLEELELQEELENEYYSIDKSNVIDSRTDERNIVFQKEEETTTIKKDDILEVTNKYIEEMPSKVIPKLELIQQVMNKQIELEEKLLELKNKDRIVNSKSKTEQDLISKLNEMDEIDDLEDDMDRLDDIIQTEDAEDSEEENSSTLLQPIKTKRSVSFADEDESETVEIRFTHSNVEPSKEPYNSEKGILKPSDVYEAYSSLFCGETTSNLKKSKYEADFVPNMEDPEVEKKRKTVEFKEVKDNVTRTIIIEDVLEKLDRNDNKLQNNESRPTSLFKKKRQQNK